MISTISAKMVKILTLLEQWRYVGFLMVPLEFFLSIIHFFLVPFTV